MRDEVEIADFEAGGGFLDKMPPRAFFDEMIAGSSKKMRLNDNLESASEFDGTESALADDPGTPPRAD